MNSRPSLTLYEEILLLALDDDKGTTAIDGMHNTAMGGAILAELVLVGALKVGENKKAPVTVVSGVAVEDELLGECLAKVVEEKKDKKPPHWVQKFAGTKDLRNRVARGLVGKGVLKEGRDKVLGIFPRTIFPESNPGPEQELRARLKKAIFTGSPNVEPRTIVIVALADATGLLKNAFDKKKLKERKKRIEKLTSGQVAGAATRDAVQAIQTAAIISTVVVPVVITSAAT